MPIGANAWMLSETRIAPFLVENDPVRINFMGRMAMRGVAGGALAVARTPRLTPGFAIDDCAEVSDNSKSIDRAEFEFAEYVDSYRLCSSAVDRYSDPNDQDLVQEVLSERALWLAIARDLFALTPSPGQIESFRTLADPGRVATLGGAVTIRAMNWLTRRVTDNEGVSAIIVSHSRIRSAFIEVCSDLGLEPTMDVNVYNPLKGRYQSVKMTQWNGCPWFDNDEAPLTPGDPDTGDIVCFVPGDQGGVGPGRGVQLILPENHVSNPFIRREVLIPGQTETEVQVTLPIGSMVGSQGAITILGEVNAVPDGPI